MVCWVKSFYTHSNHSIASDKIQLHSDATRLFFDESEGWDPSYAVKYRSRKQGARHSDRDGTAFASVVLPAHYSAICAVLHQVKHRLGAEWNVQRVIDWGAGTGSGLWYVLYFCKLVITEGPQGSAEHLPEAHQRSRGTSSVYH